MKTFFVRFVTVILLISVLLSVGCTVDEPEVTDPSGDATTCSHSYTEEQTHVCGEGVTTTLTCKNCGHTEVSFDDSEEARACRYVGGVCQSCHDVIPGTLIYAETFEYIPLTEHSGEALSYLGWSIDTMQNGAPTNGTAYYNIADYRGSRRLEITNYGTGYESGTDSYVNVLTEAQFGIFHEQNYTYQYDVWLGQASATDRYIVLLSDYNGGAYNSFHLRNRGTGNNEAQVNGSWKSYSLDATATGENAILTKVLGSPYSQSISALANKDLSIRYVVDWEKGNRIYIRLNTPNYANSGKWILVSEFDPTQTGAPYWSPEQFGGGIALKVGGKQNGYVDNIYIWAGTEEDVPETFGSGILTSSSEGCSGHHIKNGVCIYCGERQTTRTEAHEIISELTIDGTTALYANVDRVRLVPTSSGYTVTQGGCTDGRYVYLVVENQKTLPDGTKISNYKTENHYSKIVKLDPETWEIVKTSEALPIDHGNDLTYNVKTGELLLSHCQPNAKYISFVDPETLAVKQKKLLPANIGFFALAYCPEYDRYAFGTNGQDIAILDSSLELVKQHSITSTGYVTQGFDCDERYIYCLQYKQNVIMIYDWDGTLVARVDIVGLAFEPEFIFRYGGEFYIGCNNSAGGQIYRLTLRK